MTQPGLGLPSYQSGEMQFAKEAQQVQTEAGNPPGAITHQYLEQARAASSSATNSPQPARQADDTADVDTQPPGTMDNESQPTQPSPSKFFASLRAAHAAAEAERAKSAKPRSCT